MTSQPADLEKLQPILDQNANGGRTQLLPTFGKHKIYTDIFLSPSLKKLAKLYKCLWWTSLV